MRIFNTYGPNMALDDGRVVSNFVAQALTGQPLTIFGDGQQTRSFQYVSDLIEGERPTQSLILGWLAACFTPGVLCPASPIAGMRKQVGSFQPAESVEDAVWRWHVI